MNPSARFRTGLVLLVAIVSAAAAIGAAPGATPRVIYGAAVGWPAGSSPSPPSLAPSVAGNSAQDYTLQPGFALQKACELEQSFIALTFGPRTPGSHAQMIYLSVENGPILWARDADGDGQFETHGTFTSGVTNAQGLVWQNARLFAVGTRGEDPGIYRITPSKDGTTGQRIELLAPIRGSGEHGAHGIVAGPDGYLYVALGNEAAIATPPHPSSPLQSGYEGSLLPPLYDPNGFNINCRYPDGVIARVDPKNGSWIYHSVGFRNHYDLAFNAQGELFTCDSDMEWDVGLPWYRPVRALHCLSNCDYGARSGTAMWRSYYPDTVPELVVVGRGSPTGIAIYEGTSFPARLRGALLIGDWSRDQILAVPLEPKGASYTGSIETLVELRNSSGITDLAVGSDGALYFTTGGRGALGELRRLSYTAPPEVVPDAEPLGPEAQPRSDPSGAQPRSDPSGAQPRSDPPEAQPRSDPSGAQPRSDPSGAQPRSDPPGAQPRSDPSGAQPRSDPPGAQPRSDPSGAQPRSGTSGAQPSPDPPQVPAPNPERTPDAEPEPAADSNMEQATDMPSSEPPAAPIAADAAPAATPGATPSATPSPKLPPQRAIPVGRRATLAELKRRLASSDARICRRACEELVTLATLEPDVRDRLYQLLASPDPFLRQSARAALERTAAKDLFARLATEKDPERVLETVLLLARAKVVDVSADALAAELGKLMATPWGATNKARIDRVLEVVLLSSRPLSAEVGKRFAALVLERFPTGSPPTTREDATLLAHWNPPGAIGRLLDALQAESDHGQAIHYAFVLCAIESGWTADEARRLLSWFESTAGWTGGASFRGYLEAMHRRLLQHLTPEVRLAIVRDGKLGVTTLASLLVESLGDASKDPYGLHPSAETVELASALKSAYAQLGDEPGDIETKKSALRLLAGHRVAGLMRWLRRIAVSKAPENSTALIALARMHRRADQALLLRGLSSAELEVPEACAEALCAIDSKPDAPGMWAVVLDAAHKLGPPRGWSVLQVAARWLKKPYLIPKPDEWAHTLQQFDSYFNLTYPDYERAPRSEAERPNWDHERVLAFLEKSRAREGSPARGALVFQKATCASCHVFDPVEASGDAAVATPGTGAQWGPDLSTVARRFNTAQILETIEFPSRVISDQYRSSVVELDDDQRVDGRIVEQDEQAVTVLSSDGSRRAIPRSEVKTITPSKLSPMPEGLLSALTLEEIKDLFAYLVSEGKIEDADAADTPWNAMFSGPQRTNWVYDANLWNLKADVLIGRADNLPQSSWVLSKSSYRDFEIEFDVFLPNGNSGFQYRSKEDPEKPDPIGYQADIGQEYWGSLYATDGRGLLAAADPDVWRKAVDLLGWNHFYVRAQGDRQLIEINGITTVDTRDTEHRGGVIGFQLHQGMKMEVRFANMRMHSLRPR